MSFINSALLFGLIGISIPIILHLLNRRSAKQLDWGAMRFLLDSVESRRRRIQLEEALLLAARCLLCGLAALVVSRPFQSPDGKIPYVVVIPAILIGIVLITTGLILRDQKKYLFLLCGGGLALLVFSGMAIAYEKHWNLKSKGDMGRKDVVLIIDGSTSMQIKHDGATNFDRAITEAKEILDKSSGGNAYSVILGGPLPQVKVADPTVNKNDINGALESLKPVQGKMDGFSALTAALTSLSRGLNPNKQIIVFTDGQSTGWKLDADGAWESLGGSARQLSPDPEYKPSIIYRKFELPAAFRNVSLGNLRLSRDVVGTDRPVTIEATLENTGTEAISPSSVELSIGTAPAADAPAPKAPTAGAPAPQAGQEPHVVLKDSKLGQLPPGAKETVRFTHKFSAAGSHILRAKVIVKDDLAQDDQTESVATVSDRVRVLLVEGKATEEIMKRTTTYTALALLPHGAALAPVTTTTTPTPPPAGNTVPAPASSPGVLIDLSRSAHTQLATIPSFADYHIIIMCNVSKIPESAAAKIGAWVQSGGGLLIAPGADSEPTFYNQWETIDGATLLPGKLLTQRIIPSDHEPQGMALNTFTHQALRLVADAKQSDLGTTVFQRYWRIDSGGPLAEKTIIGGRLGNGDPFLTMHELGAGTVMLSAAPFETESGNLATRQAFVPLVHQLVYYLTAPQGQPMVLQPARQVNIPLSNRRADGGLLAEFFKGHAASGSSIATRVEGKLENNFATNPQPVSVPKGKFLVRLTGSILPKHSDTYIFDAAAQGQISLWINEKPVISRSGQGHAKLEAGKLQSIRVEYEAPEANGTYQIGWRTTNDKLLKREVIPAEALQPYSPEGDSIGTQIGMMSVIGPDNIQRAAQKMFTRAGVVARMSSDIVPGIYKILLPKDRTPELARIVSSDGSIPFAVMDDPAESRLTQWTETETAMVKSHFKFFEPKDAKAVADILANREFGEELWKYLAVGALFFLLAETALTRWIAKNRRSGEEISLDFEHKFQAPKEFTNQLNKIKQATAA